MTDQAPTDNTSEEQPAEARGDREPDESTLLGKFGVEEEVLAELARAEARLSDPSAADDPDATGAQV